MTVKGNTSCPLTVEAKTHNFFTPENKHKWHILPIYQFLFISKNQKILDILLTQKNDSKVDGKFNPMYSNIAN